MLRGIFKSITEQVLQPYFKKNVESNKAMDLADQLYKQGKKAEALQAYKDIYAKNGSYKPVYGKIVDVQEELEKANLGESKSKSNTPNNK